MPVAVEVGAVDRFERVDCVDHLRGRPDDDRFRADAEDVVRCGPRGGRNLLDVWSVCERPLGAIDGEDAVPST